MKSFAIAALIGCASAVTLSIDTPHSPHRLTLAQVETGTEAGSQIIMTTMAGLATAGSSLLGMGGGMSGVADMAGSLLGFDFGSGGEGAAAATASFNSNYEVICTVLEVENNCSDEEIDESGMQLLAQTSRENLIALSQIAARGVEAGNNFTLKCERGAITNGPPLVAGGNAAYEEMIAGLTDALAKPKGMTVRWWKDDQTNIVDQYIITSGDDKLPWHGEGLEYHFGDGEAQGNNWSAWDNFGAVWDGWWTSNTDETVDFKLQSDDGSFLEIDGHRVVTASCCDEQHGWFTFTKGQRYYFHIEWTEGSGGAFVKLQWDPEGQYKPLSYDDFEAIQ